MVILVAIAILLVFGDETWRRICPLYFLSQIPRALGLKPLLNIDNNGGRPGILRLPIVVQLLFNAFVVLVSAIWLVRTWNQSQEKYKKDSLAHSFRRQLEMGVCGQCKLRRIFG